MCPTLDLHATCGWLAGSTAADLEIEMVPAYLYRIAVKKADAPPS